MKKLLWFLLLATLAWPQAIPYSYYVPAYAYGSGGPATGGRIYSGNSAVGVSTVTLYSSTVALSNGHTIVPYATNASITIGSGATQETVTPTAISGCYPGAGIGTCTITANFTFVHIQGEFISSATYGLQEAINDATTAGGGTLVIDNTWQGTSGMITGANGNTHVVIQDNRQGQTLYTWNGTNYAPSNGTGISPAFQITNQTFNATESFNNSGAQNQMFVLTLTGNVTSSLMQSNTAGQMVEFLLCEDATGGWTFAWPANFNNPPTLKTTANFCNTAQFIYDTNTAKWQATANPNGGNGTPGGSNNQVQINNNGVFGAIANPTTPAGVNQALIAQPGGTPQFALDSYPPNTQTGNYTVAVTDRGAVIDTTDSANDTYTAPDPTASGFGLNFGYTVCNDGTGTITENRSGTSQFNFGGTLQTSITIPPFWCAEHNSDNTNFYVHEFANFLGFPGTGAQTALTFNSTTGVIGTLSGIVTQTANFTAGNIPKAADANNLADGYPALGTDANIPTASSITNGLAVCGDANGGLSPCANGSGSGQTNYPISYQTMIHPLGLSSTAATTVANTITATTLLSSFEGRQDVPPGVMLPATFGVKTIKVRAFGSFASVTTPNLTITPLLGGVAFGSGFAFSAVPAGPVQWQVDFYFTVTGITTAQYGGCASYISAGAVTQVCISGQATGLNFAASQNIDLQATWSAASASNTITANEITAYPVHTL